MCKPSPPTEHTGNMNRTATINDNWKQKDGMMKLEINTQINQD